MSACASHLSCRMLIPFAFVACLSSTAAFAAPGAAGAVRVGETYGKLPLYFEANRGQVDPAVRFLARGAGYGIYLTTGEAVLVLAGAKSSVLRMSLLGAAPEPTASGLEQQSGRANYLIGNDPAGWHTSVPTYAKVSYRNVYPGIDLIYYGNQRQLEYDFVVAPGADPRQIAMRFRGADKLQIDSQGELVLSLPGGDLRQRKPVIYQEIDGIRHAVAGRYIVKGPNSVGFQLAAHDRSRPLVIDPIVLSYSTFLGGANADSGDAIAVDSNGNAYVAGRTTSTNFPTAAGSYRSTNSGSSSLGDIFVVKLDTTGSSLDYATYLGGSGNEIGSVAIAVDAAGDAFLTGATSSSDFPTTLGAFDPLFSGGSTYPPGSGTDAFVTKLNPTGSALIYSSYLGGSGDESGLGISVDAAGSAYVVGSTSCAQTSATPTTNCANNFPTTRGAYRTGADQPSGGGFVTKVNSNGSGLSYSTFMGYLVNAIALDPDGNAYLSSYGVSPTSGAFQIVAGGGVDAGVTKLNAGGSALVYSTYLGGSGDDRGYGIAVDAARNAYLAGGTTSIDFPTTAGAYQPTYGGGDTSVGDAFVAKLDPIGSSLLYSTYLGGTGADEARAIALDAAGNAYVTGETLSTDFPTTGDAFQTTGRNWDAYLTVLNASGSAPLYSSYLGGASVDAGYGVAVDGSGGAYVAGYTASDTFPITPGAFQQTYGGGCCDAFVAKFSGDGPPNPATTRYEQDAAVYTGAWTTYGAETGTFSQGTVLDADQYSASATFSFTGTAVNWIGVRCNVCGVATVSIDGGAPTLVNTAGPRAPGSLTSEVMYSAWGLAPGTTHTLVITVSGAETPSNDLTYGSNVAVDAFDVTK